MHKSSVFAICLLALFPAAHSQAQEVEFSSGGGTPSDSIMVYSGRNYDTGKEKIGANSALSARQLEQIQRDFPKQESKLDDLKRTVDEQKRENDTLRNSNDALSRKVDDMQRTIDEMRRSINDLSSKIK